MARTTRPGFIYLIYSIEFDAYKIGLSGEPKRRLQELRRKYRDDSMRIIKTVKSKNMLFTEKYFHSYFKDKRLPGEWFDLTELDTKEFELLASWGL